VWWASACGGLAAARHGAMSGPTRIDVETLLAQHPSFDPNADH